MDTGDLDVEATDDVSPGFGGVWEGVMSVCSSQTEGGNASVRRRWCSSRYSPIRSTLKYASSESLVLAKDTR